MNDLMSKLDRMVDDINTGAKSISSLSSHLSSTSITSISFEDSQGEEGWRELRRELEGVGISAKILSEQRGFIVKWFMNAIKSGRLEADNQDSRSIELAEDMQPEEEEVRRPLQAHLQIPPLPSGERSRKARRSWVKRFRYILTTSRDALANAVQQRDMAQISDLLDREAPIDDANRPSHTALEAAVLNNDKEILQLLLNQGSVTSESSRAGVLTKTLEFAASEEKRDCVETLLENRVAFHCEVLEPMAKSHSVPIILLMLQYADPNMMHGRECSDEERCPLLRHAAYYDIPEMFELLLRLGWNLHSLTKRVYISFDRYAYTARLTPLHIACAKCNADIVKLALAHGANIEALDENGETPLHKAVSASEGLGVTRFTKSNTREVIRNRNFDPGKIVQLLLGNGANVNVKDNYGQTALHLAAKYNEETGINALIRGNVEVDAVDSLGNTALHHAASLRDPHSRMKDEARIPHRMDVLGGQAALQCLLKAGAKVDTKNFRSLSPLHLASTYGAYPRVETLLEAGANIEASDHNKWTPIHHAVAAGSSSVVMLLATRGADLNAKGLVRVIGSYEAEHLMTPLNHAKHLKLDVIDGLLENHLRHMTGAFDHREPGMMI